MGLAEVTRCYHPETELRYRRSLSRGVVYQHQCARIACLRGIGPEWLQVQVSEDVRVGAARWRLRRNPGRRRREYSRFKRSKVWRSLRARAAERDGWCCRMCSSPIPDGEAECHQRTYPENLRDTTLEMLVTLCRECHDSEHDRR